MSGQHKGTQDLLEPNDWGEVIYFFPSWYDDRVSSQSVCSALVKEDSNTYLSFIMNAVFENRDMGYFAQMFFTEEEVDLLIDGLKKAKEMWNENKGE